MKKSIYRIHVIVLLSFLLCPLIVIYPSQIAGKSGDIASFYGDGEKLNKYTANGEAFNSNDLTCASWHYPFNTKLKVVNHLNGKHIIVRVNDRGPNKRLGRSIDLTKKAFSKIANTKEGLIFVKIEKVS